MKEDPNVPDPFPDLRRWAENRLEQKKREAAAPELQGDIQRIDYELQVLQIELEMQNEELRRTQVELETERTRYFDLYDLALVGYCTISEKGLILESNLTAAAMLDVARGAFIKQPLSRFILPQDRANYYRQHTQLFETGESYTCELGMVKRDGKACWVHLVARAVQKAKDESICLIVMSDITERKQVEESLREAKNKFQELTESISDVFFAMDRNLTYTFWNKACEKLTGFSAAEAVGRNITEIFPDNEARQQSIDLYLRVIKDQKPELSTVSYPGDEHIVHEIRTYPTADGISVFVMDITERKRMDEKLRKSEYFFKESQRAAFIGSYETDSGRLPISYTSIGNVLTGRDSPAGLRRKRFSSRPGSWQLPVPWKIRPPAGVSVMHFH